MKIKDGIINLNTTRGKMFGFTSDLFFGYLWKLGDVIMISFIESRQEKKGNLRALFDHIEARGFTVAVPTPSSRMRAICRKRGMISHWEEGCEVMQRQSA